MENIVYTNKYEAKGAWMVPAIFARTPKAPASMELILGRQYVMKT